MSDQFRRGLPIVEPAVMRHFERLVMMIVVSMFVSVIIVSVSVSVFLSVSMSMTVARR